MLISLTEAAEQSLLAISSYIAQEDDTEAERIAQVIINAMRSLEKLPKRGRPGRVEGTLELLVPDLPYLLVYTVMQKEVQIVQVLHQRQKWPSAAED